MCFVIMQHLLSVLQGNFPKANIRQLDEQMVEVSFQNAKESIIIQQQQESERYMVSYPKLIVDSTRRIRKEEIVTNSNILLEGVFGILKQVQKHGKVLPEFYS